MKLIDTTIVACLIVLNARHGFGDDNPATKSTAKPRPAAPPAAAAPKAEAATPKKPAAGSGTPAAAAQAKDVVPARPAADEKRSVDEKRTVEEAAIRKSGDSYVVAFNEGNSKSVAEHYTEDAEYVDEQGRIFLGRAAIEDSLKHFFTECPDCKLGLQINSIRFVGPAVAVEDGTTSVVRSKNADPSVTRYTVVHVKHGGKWLTASARDFTVPNQRQHRAQVKQLDWMIGDWVHEGNDAVVEFSCKAVDNGNFLLRSFTIRIAGQEAMSGSQRIGWNAQAGNLHSWIFDSDGGHSDGYWHRDGDSWVLKVTGVTADGQTASSTSIYKFVDAHTMTFQSVDHEVAGVEFPDSAKVKIVRRPPRPE